MKTADSSVPEYHQIRTCTEGYFQREGDSPLGMGWPNAPDARRRFDVMLDVIRDANSPAELLDFGCGTGHLYEHILKREGLKVGYHGIDLSPMFIQRALQKHPNADFVQGDVLQNPQLLQTYDYAVINGVFTSKCQMQHEQMLDFMQQILELLFSHVRIGMAFNAMSTHVDWERNDLFHLPLDTIARFLVCRLSRDFVIRNDYGLYEFTTYVYRS